MKRILWLIFVFLVLLCGCNKKEENNGGKENKEVIYFEKVSNKAITRYIRVLTDEEPYFFQMENNGHTIVYRLIDSQMDEIVRVPGYSIMTLFYSKNSANLLSVVDLTEETNYEYLGEIRLFQIDNENNLTEEVILEKTTMNMVFSLDKETGTINSYTCNLKKCAYYNGKDYDGSNYYSLLGYSNGRVEILHLWEEGQSLKVLFNVKEMNEVGKRYLNIYNVSYPNNNKLFIVEENGLYGVLDNEGRERIPVIYKSIGKYKYTQEEIMLVTPEYVIAQNQEGMYGIINLDNAVLTPFEYDDIIRTFENGKKFLASKNGKYGLIDINGKILMDFMYDDIVSPYISEEDLENGIIPYYAIVKDGKVGVLNENNEEVIPLIYDLPDWGNTHYIYDDPECENNFEFSVSKNGPILSIFKENGEKITYDKNGVIIISDSSENIKKTEIGYEGYYILRIKDGDVIFNKKGEEVYDTIDGRVRLYFRVGDELFWQTSVIGDNYIQIRYFDGGESKEELYDLETKKVVLSGRSIEYVRSEDRIYICVIDDNGITLYNMKFESLSTIPGDGIDYFLGDYYRVRKGTNYYIYRLVVETANRKGYR